MASGGGAGGGAVSDWENTEKIVGSGVMGHSWDAALARARGEFEGEGKSGGQGGGMAAPAARGEGVGRLGRLCFNRSVAALRAAPSRLCLGVRSRLRRGGYRKVGEVVFEPPGRAFGTPAQRRLFVGWGMTGGVIDGSASVIRLGGRLRAASLGGRTAPGAGPARR
jgi:hypothetical protein